jgi:Glycosyl transferase family 2
MPGHWHGVCEGDFHIMKRLASIIVTAHNAEASIAHCLRTLLRGSLPGELEVVVVCHGCSDRTADIVAEVAPELRVIRTPVGSRSNAINLGSSVTSGFPKVVVDAQASIDIDSVRAMVVEMANSGKPIATPRIHVDTTLAPRSVRSFYRIKARLPDAASHTVGGVYALSMLGASRLGRLPAVSACDTFTRMGSPPSDWATVEGATCTVSAPTNFFQLCNMEYRHRRGSQQVLALWPELATNFTTSSRNALLSIAKAPKLWPALMVYAVVVALARLAGTWGQFSGSSREAADSGSTARTSAAGRAGSRPLKVRFGTQVLHLWTLGRIGLVASISLAVARLPAATSKPHAEVGATVSHNYDRFMDRSQATCHIPQLGGLTATWNGVGPSDRLSGLSIDLKGTYKGIQDVVILVDDGARYRAETALDGHLYLDPTAVRAIAHGQRTEVALVGKAQRMELVLTPGDVEAVNALLRLCDKETPAVSTLRQPEFFRETISSSTLGQTSFFGASSGGASPEGFLGVAP